LVPPSPYRYSIRYVPSTCPSPALPSPPPILGLNKKLRCCSIQNRPRACRLGFKRGAIRAAPPTGRSQSRGLRNPLLHFCARPNWLCYGAAQNGRLAHPLRMAQCSSKAREREGPKGVRHVTVGVNGAHVVILNSGAVSWGAGVPEQLHRLLEDAGRRGRDPWK